MNYIKHVMDQLQPIFTLLSYFYCVWFYIVTYVCERNHLQKNKFRNATRCLCRSLVDAQPQVSMLMTHYQSEEGDYRELRVFLERKRAACNHGLILRAALELCLITAELWSAPL